MENTENKEETKLENTFKKDSTNQIAGAILIAGFFIAGAILLKDAKPSQAPQGIEQENLVSVDNLPSVSLKDRVLGNTFAKVTIIEYADFQCPFCGKFFKEVKETVIKDYLAQGKIRFIYRDFAFLGTESIQSALAARCAHDQGKFWEYHDYLYTNQSKENEGIFSNENLKSIAKNLSLNQAEFNECFDNGKYITLINEEKEGGKLAGVRGTPKGFILVNDKVVSTIDGAESASTVRTKIENALK